jgi:hypothetical protein
MELIKDNVYRERKSSGKYGYYEKRICLVCNKEFYCNKYEPTSECSAECKGGQRVRPIGTKLSDNSKDKIRLSRTGKIQDNDTKKKISNGVKQAYENGIYDINQIKGINHCLFKHGYSLYSEYRKLRGLCSRCYNENNKNYKYYGGRGIKVSDIWLNDFTKFLEFLQRNGFKKGMTLHRIDPNGPYSPDNVVILDPSTHSRLHSIMRSYRKEKQRLIYPAV